jgi:hypothetical protein
MGLRSPKACGSRTFLSEPEPGPGEIIGQGLAEAIPGDKFFCRLLAFAGFACALNGSGGFVAGGR